MDSTAFFLWFMTKLQHNEASKFSHFLQNTSFSRIKNVQKFHFDTRTFKTLPFLASLPQFAPPPPGHLIILATPLVPPQNQRFIHLIYHPAQAPNTKKSWQCRWSYPYADNGIEDRQFWAREKKKKCTRLARIRAWIL